MNKLFLNLRAPVASQATQLNIENGLRLEFFYPELRAEPFACFWLAV